jgi:Eco57I restriction-modification methylase
MSLIDRLRDVHALADVPRLMASLGHDPLWEELPAGSHPGACCGPASRAATVGQYAGFTWLGLETDSPARLARRVARHLAAAGRPAGVVAVYPQGRRLAIAAGPAMLEVSLDRPDAVSVACIQRLAAPAAGPVAYAEHAAEALDGEGVGRAFFRGFRSALEALAAGWPRHVPARDRHALALVQLTRVLFLYFLQSKGWLDNRTDFIARAVDDCLGHRRHLERQLLQPLFFGTLNRRPADRGSVARRLGRVPFLNGGLFEPHALERCWRVRSANVVWRDIFDSLFERFHFTVSESPDQSAVAPDMLGRVFEGVMDPGDRHDSGTFYTPARLVSEIVNAGLAAFVGSRLHCSDAEAAERMASGEQAALSILRAVTILDPAVGSGAFLLGALDRLAALRARETPRPSALKREILRRNLFGVDRHPMAVRLTELRLWLAVVADEPDGAAARIAPLPNLDYLIRQGDSLAGPPGSHSASAETARAVGVGRRRAITAVGPIKRRLIRELRAAEVTAAAERVAASERRIAHQITELLSATRAPTLFGDRPRMPHETRVRLAALRAAQRTVRAARRRLAADGALPWFDYPSQFADVFAQGGFDLIVGNPPWVRAEALPALEREQLATRYGWWRGMGRGFAHRPDLSIAFLERSHELTAPGGAMALLVPAKIATTGYAARARAALSASACLHVVADLGHDASAAFDATTYPMALVVTKRSAPPSHQVRTSLDVRAAHGPAQAALGAAPWILGAGRAADVARALAERCPLLSERYVCRLGVKTGADAVFLDPPGPIERALLRWALRGRDVSPFVAIARRRLLWTHDAHGRPLERLPPSAAAHCAAHENRLRGRSDFRGGPYWGVFRVGAAVAEHRVVWADLSRELSAVALSGAAAAAFIPLNTCYAIVTGTAAETHALTGWLNSTPIRRLARLVATPASGGFARHGAATIGSLPLPAAAVRDPDLVTLARRMSGGERLQGELDEVVYGHLALDERERASLPGSDHRC